MNTSEIKLRNDYQAGTGKPTLKATIEPVKNVFANRRTKRYVCKLADTGWQIEGSDREMLVDALRIVLTRQCEFLHTRKYVRVKDVTFALYFANGWQYDIVHDDGKTSSCMLNISDVKSYGDALSVMMRHVQQYRES